MSESQTSGGNAAAGAGVIGGVITAGMQSHMSDKAWSRQKRILRNKVRWHTRDLRLAGLNPILAATGGTPSGSAPAAANMPDLQGVGDRLEKGKAGKETRRMGVSQRDLQLAQVGATNAGAAKSRSDVFVNAANIENTNAQTALAGAAKAGQELQNIHHRMSIPKRTLEAEFYGTKEGYYNYRLERWVKPVTAGAAGVAAGAYGIKNVLGGTKKMGGLRTFKATERQRRKNR